MVVVEGEMASVSPAREGFAVSPRFSRERKQELRGKANGEPEGSPFPITNPLFQSRIRFFNHESTLSSTNPLFQSRIRFFNHESAFSITDPRF